MNIRARLSKIEKSLAWADRYRLSRKPFLWDPHDPISTAFVMKQTFETPHPQRRYQIRIAGGPSQKIVDKIARETIPDKEALQSLSDAELDACTRRFMDAYDQELTKSRRAAGLPPVAWHRSRPTGGEAN